MVSVWIALSAVIERGEAWVSSGGCCWYSRHSCRERRSSRTGQCFRSGSWRRRWSACGSRCPPSSRGGRRGCRRGGVAGIPDIVAGSDGPVELDNVSALEVGAIDGQRVDRVVRRHREGGGVGVVGGVLLVFQT